jgi:sulfur-carrier protein
MPVLRIPTPLRSYTNGQSEVNVSGSNISDALTDLTTQYPALKPHLFNEGGELRPFVNLFVGENNIKDLQGVNTPIRDGEKIMLIPSIAGGCGCEEGTLPYDCKASCKDCAACRWQAISSSCHSEGAFFATGESLTQSKRFFASLRMTELRGKYASRT